MSDDRLSCEDAAEVMRKLQRYREMILSGKLVLPPSRASQLVGPDCLYHLYSLAEPGSHRHTPRKPSARGKTRRKRRAAARSRRKRRP